MWPVSPTGREIPTDGIYNLTMRCYTKTKREHEIQYEDILHFGFTDFELFRVGVFRLFFKSMFLGCICFDCLMCNHVAELIVERIPDFCY